MRQTTLTLCFATLSALAACGGGSDATPTVAAPTGDSSTAAEPVVDPTSPPVNPPANPPVNPPASSAITVANSCALPSFQSDVMAAMNAARSQARNCGAKAYAAAPAVRWNDKLFAASAGHSADMAARNNMSHIGSDGSEFWDRTKKQGYTTATGENVAYGYGSVQDVMQGWVKSAGHCENIMKSTANDVAVACVRSSNSTPYWTMLLGKS
jgi:uncharacterized protein YkwD